MPQSWQSVSHVYRQMDNWLHVAIDMNNTQNCPTTT